MSVRVGDRHEGDLQVLNKAKILKEYSLNLLKSDKVFPKSTRWLFAYDLAEKVRSVVIHIRQANAVYVPQDEPRRTEAIKYRYSEQLQAHSNLDVLYDLVEDAYNAHYIDGKRTAYWTNLIQETDDSLKGWMKSDKERYIG